MAQNSTEGLDPSDEGPDGIEHERQHLYEGWLGSPMQVQAGTGLVLALVSTVTRMEKELTALHREVKSIKKMLEGPCDVVTEVNLEEQGWGGP